MKLPLFKDNEIYTPVEIAEKLKFTKATVYDWIKSGKLRALKVSGKYRIFGKDINDLIEVKNERN